MSKVTDALLVVGALGAVYLGYRAYKKVGNGVETAGKVAGAFTAAAGNAIDTARNRAADAVAWLEDQAQQLGVAATDALHAPGRWFDANVKAIGQPSPSQLYGPVNWDDYRLSDTTGAPLNHWSPPDAFGQVLSIEPPQVNGIQQHAYTARTVPDLIRGSGFHWGATQPVNRGASGSW